MITQEGRRIRSNILTGVAGIVAVMIALVIVALFGSQDAVSGPSGSSYVTTPMGTAGLAETLERLGATVVRSRSPISPDVADGTLMLLDVAGAGYASTEIDAIASAVAGGATLVMSGVPNSEVVDALDIEVDWSASTAISGSTSDGATVTAARFGVFLPSSDGETLVSAGDNALVIRVTRGLGQVVLISDASIIANTNLVANAEFVVGLTGTERIVFDELRHGYGEGGETGLTAAMSDEWRRTLWLLALAGVVVLVVYGRRFGPPEPEGRQLIPARSQLIESVAMSLRRSGDPVGASAPTRRAVLETVRTRSMLGPDAGEDDLRRAAASILDPDEVDAIFDPSPDTVLTADRALARLGSEQRDM